MPEVGADGEGGFDGFDEFVDAGLEFEAAAGPEGFPGEEFGEVEEEAEEGDEVAVAGAVVGAALLDVGFEGEEALAGRGWSGSMLFEACHAGDAELRRSRWLCEGIGVSAAVGPSAQGVEESALAFVGPHESVDVVGAGVVFDESEGEGLVVGVVVAGAVGVFDGGAAVEVDFVEFFPGGGGAFVVVFEDPGEGFHAVLFGGGDEVVEEVEGAVVGGAHVGVGEGGVFVVLHVGDGEVSAAEGGGGLHAGGDLGVSVDEGEEGVDSAAGAHVVEGLVEVAFGAWGVGGLDADVGGFFWWGGLRGGVGGLGGCWQ